MPPTSVEIEKKDKDTAEPVYNAVLQVLDENGVVMDEWTTDGTVHEVKGVLTAGQKYIIHEKTTPVGYKQSDDVTFIAPTEEPPYKVTFYNVKIPDDVPKTGDMFSVILIIGIAGVALVGIGMVIWARKKARNCCASERGHRAFSCAQKMLFKRHLICYNKRRINETNQLAMIDKQLLLMVCYKSKESVRENASCLNTEEFPLQLLL